jgi:hypothetical protein
LWHLSRLHLGDARTRRHDHRQRLRRWHGTRLLAEPGRLHAGLVDVAQRLDALVDHGLEAEIGNAGIDRAPEVNIVGMAEGVQALEHRQARHQRVPFP